MLKFNMKLIAKFITLIFLLSCQSKKNATINVDNMPLKGIIINEDNLKDFNLNEGKVSYTDFKIYLIITISFQITILALYSLPILHKRDNSWLIYILESKINNEPLFEH